MRLAPVNIWQLRRTMNNKLNNRIKKLDNIKQVDILTLV